MNAILSPETTIDGDRPGKTPTRVGWALSILVILLLLSDAIPKILKLAFVIESSKGLGITPDTWPVIGTLLLIFTVLYAVPRTSVFGAVFVTAYLGGAVCANVLTHAPFFSLILAPVYIAILAWLGLYLRSGALRRLVRIGY